MKPPITVSPPVAPVPREARGPRYRYTFLHRLQFTAEEWAEKLNRLGADGWRICGASDGMVYFERTVL